MKMAAFNAVCPYEIGDKVKVLKQVQVTPFAKSYMVDTATITDIACTHYIKAGKIEFSYELDNSGEYIPLITAKEAGYQLPER